jgi:hypothetical protein
MTRRRKFRWMPAKDGAVLVALLTLAIVLTTLIGNARPSAGTESRPRIPPRSELLEVCAAAHVPNA